MPLLMLRVKRGDRAAFAELVEKYKQPVMNLVYRTLRDATEAEDLAQIVFLQVYKSAKRYESRAKFSTWLFTIARNLCLNEIRRRSRHPADSLEEAHAEHEDQPRQQFEDQSNVLPPEQLLHGELAQKIEEALAGLAGKPAHRHPALPAGGVELRGNRRNPGLLAFRHQVAHSSRARNAQGEIETVSENRRLERMNFQALILRLILLHKNSDSFSSFEIFVFIRVHLWLKFPRESRHSRRRQGHAHAGTHQRVAQAHAPRVRANPSSNTSSTGIRRGGRPRDFHRHRLARRRDRKSFRRRQKIGTRSISFGRQVVQDGTGKAPELAKEFVGDSPFLLTYGDILVPPETYPQMIRRFGEGDFAGVITVTPGEDVTKGGLNFFDEQFCLKRLVEKPSPEQLEQLRRDGWLKPGVPAWYNAGIYIFRPAIVRFHGAPAKIAARRIRTDRRHQRDGRRRTKTGRPGNPGPLGGRARPRNAGEAGKRIEII